MEHYWCLLRHQQKWQQHISTLGTRRRPQGEAALDTVEENIEVFAERPQGKKIEKERERKRKSMEGKESEISISLAKMTEDRATTMEERRNAQLKADEKSEKIFELKKKKFELEKKKFEGKMMMLDLRGMNAMQQEYFRNIQVAIFEESKSHSGGRSNSHSTPYYVDI
ncbi:hypothetical protein F2P56_037149 [Juglans regia]|uniref:No apical meristem-associated C-terminal domain-containing protein n=1 Tax=Juglans regia TaxID=51240 RepID=A0A833TUR2_JUGRE|nr:hypothetical protein F2P56_037149 [Juglans regia]